MELVRLYRRSTVPMRNPWQAAALAAIFVMTIGGSHTVDAAEKQASKASLGNKTLVVWAAPANLTQRGGSALTIDDGQSHFDGIIFGEAAAGKWMAGSDFWQRTQPDQANSEAETADPKTAVQIAAVYKDRQVTLYREGKKYAEYMMESAPQTFGPESAVLIGRRHLEQADDARFAGTINDARIYDSALSADQIAALRPHEASLPMPWAWWTFDGPQVKERTGRFPKTELLGGAKVERGKLVLDGRTGQMFASLSPMAIRPSQRVLPVGPPPDTNAVRHFRHHLLADPYRPAYHFVVPEGLCSPFDPNGAIFWHGRVHLFYIYQDGAHKFGHISSIDLVHWREHLPALFPTPDSPEKGIFSGNCFINKQGEATMIYHGVAAGNCIATSTDPNLDVWKKLPGNPIIPIARHGEPYDSWDPDGWLEGDTYYAIFGGKKASIFKAKELNKWTYVGPLMHNTVPGVDLHEDVSCADFFKLGDKRVLVCISHRLGTRYYVGQWKDEQFHPEFHERMSWVDNAFFAPESFTHKDGRRIMWAWIFDGRSPATRAASGWSGELSLPRVLTLGDDNHLRMNPVEELKLLRYNPQTLENLTIEADKEQILDKIQGNTIELDVEMRPDAATQQCGVKVCRSPHGEEETLVYYDAVDKKLKVDVRQASLGEGPKNIEAGPFELKPGEPLKLRIFVDKSVVEVFANDGRQAVMRRIYPTRADSLGVALFSNGGTCAVPKVRAWDMMPSNPY